LILEFWERACINGIPKVTFQYRIGVNSNNLRPKKKYPIRGGKHETNLSFFVVLLVGGKNTLNKKSELIVYDSSYTPVLFLLGTIFLTLFQQSIANKIREFKVLFLFFSDKGPFFF